MRTLFYWIEPRWLWALIAAWKAFDSSRPSAPPYPDMSAAELAWTLAAMTVAFALIWCALAVRVGAF